MGIMVAKRDSCLRKSVTDSFSSDHDFFLCSTLGNTDGAAIPLQYFRLFVADAAFASILLYFCSGRLCLSFNV